MIIDKIINRISLLLEASKKRTILSRVFFVGNGVNVGSYTIIQNPSSLSIGNCTQIADFTVLLCENSVNIGSNCRISTSCMISSVTHKIPSYDRISDDKVFGRDLSIKIGNNVWIGANTVILPGTKIGDNSIIAAGSVVRGEIPDDEIWGGTPAIFMSKIIFSDKN